MPVNSLEHACKQSVNMPVNSLEHAYKHSVNSL